MGWLELGVVAHVHVLLLGDRFVHPIGTTPSVHTRRAWRICSIWLSRRIRRESWSLSAVLTLPPIATRSRPPRVACDDATEAAVDVTDAFES